MDNNKYIHTHKFYNLNNKTVEKYNVEFELTDEYLKIGDKKLKLVEKGIGYEYTYKFLKTQINVISIKEFKKYILNSMETGNIWNAYVNNLFRKIRDLGRVQ
jgi:hypothetical protein